MTRNEFLTPEQHRLRHVELHQALVKLIERWAATTDCTPNSSIMELLAWPGAKSMGPELFEALDELVADWIAHNVAPLSSNKTLSNTSILELLLWANEQAKEPANLPGSPDETTGDSDA